MSDMLLANEPLIRLEQFRDPAEQRLDRMLTQPFRSDDTTYALGRREPVQ